jgi:outer membrane protein TolC
MTDPRRSTSGLLAVVVLAPAAAGALAVGTGWALAHPPRHQAVAAGSAVTAADEPHLAVDRTDARLHQQALTAQRRVEQLTRALHHLRARAEALRAAPLPGAGASGFAPGPSGVGGGVSVPAPPVATAPRPATHTSTGAS